MAKSIELQIHKFLSEFEDLSLTADALLRAIEKQSLKREAAFAVSSFLFHSGFFPTLLSFSLKNLDRGRPVSWPFFAETIRMFYKDSEPKLLDAIIQAAESLNELPDLTNTKCLDDIDERLPHLRQGLRQQAKAAHLNEKQKILDKIHFYRSQNALESERKLVLQLMQKFPRDPEGAAEYTTYQERKANFYIKNYKKSQPLSIEPPPLNNEEKEILKLWHDETEQILEYEHDASIDMALMFFFMEDYNTAIEFADKARGAPLRNWLIIESLINAKRFADGLHFLLKMEKKIIGESESFISINYYRSLCYYGLGQVETAVAIIEGVIAVKPQFRMASTLYSQWSRELE